MSIIGSTNMKKAMAFIQKYPKAYRIILFFWGFYRRGFIYSKLLKIARIVNVDTNTTIFYDLDLLLGAQLRDGNFSRMDIIVKYLALEEVYGKNNGGIAIFEKMQKIINLVIQSQYLN